MNFTRVSKLSNLVTNDLKRKPTVILDPNNSNPFRISGTATNISVTIDADEWILPDKIKDYITRLGQSGMNIEQRILALYEEICKEYVYDDNVLSYIRKNDDDTGDGDEEDETDEGGDSDKDKMMMVVKKMITMMTMK